jgi:cold shock protein
VVQSRKGYEFIQPVGGGKDIFVHISAIERARLPGLSEGQTVEFELASNRGKTLSFLFRRRWLPVAEW